MEVLRIRLNSYWIPVSYTHLQSIALQEAALAHILNAEGEKIQRVVCEAKCVDDLLNVNESVTNTIQAVSTLEEMLKDKAIAVIDELSGRVC